LSGTGITLPPRNVLEKPTISSMFFQTWFASSGSSVFVGDIFIAHQPAWSA
jgi:hypothetical protein